MAKESERDRLRKEQEKLNRPPRKQDPYVTGVREGYKQGGEGGGGGQGGNGDKDESCGGEFVAKLPELVLALFSPAKRQAMRENARLAWERQVAQGGFPPHGHHVR